MDNYTYTGTFLEDFPKLSRSLIANQFCHAVRDGCGDIDSVIAWVREDADKRIRYTRDETAAAVQTMLKTGLKTEEARNFAEFILTRESLPWDKRNEMKEERGTVYRNEYMAEQEPTEKQLKYLRGLGCKIIPQSKLEASQLIERYKR